MIGARMLQGPFLSVLEARTVDDFRQQVIRFSQSLGFGTISAMAVVDHSLTHTEFHTVDNTPAAFSNAYHDKRIAVLDPVMQHTKHSSIPIVWNQDIYVQEGKGELWEHQAQFGYLPGIALALHFPGGLHFGLGVDTDRDMPSRSKTLTRLVADLQLFAVHVQEAAFRIFAPPAIDADNRPLLTPREVEALRWTMDGKTAAEVGEALRISERTAVFHLQNAVKKLGCVGKHQAVLKAIRMRLFV
ncbi:MAG: autoinducer binding domain-containing protein [Betaproteobacteria bacterium]